MAEYGRVGLASDYGAVKSPSTAQSSILNIKETTTVVVDFGSGPYTVEHFKELGRKINDLPPGKTVGVEYYSDREGERLKLTIC